MNPYKSPSKNKQKTKSKNKSISPAKPISPVKDFLEESHISSLNLANTYEYDEELEEDDPFYFNVNFDKERTLILVMAQMKSICEYA